MAQEKYNENQNVSHICNLKIPSSHTEKSKMEKINFDTIFYLTLHIQNIIILKYNQEKIYWDSLLFSPY